MAIVTSLLVAILSFWPWIALAIILALTLKLFWKPGSSSKTADLFVGLPEIKPHWFWGNLDISKHFNDGYVEHYRRMKGLRYCTFYDCNVKKLFVLDPDIITKIMNTDFDHFERVPFFPVEYSDVSINILSFYCQAKVLV